MAAGRIANMGVGVAMVPLLIHFLRGEGFASWALLLSTAAAFSALDLGMPTALVRHLAVALREDDIATARRLVSTALALLCLVYAGIGALLLPIAPLASRWLRIPDGSWLTPAELITLTFVAVGTRSVLILGSRVLYAARRFDLVALLALLQGLLSNLAATVAAWASHRVDVVFLAYWLAQLFVVSASVWLARRLFRGTLRVGVPDRSSARRLLTYGVKVQLQEWAQTINFQLDKFVILAALGLHGVARYEVANRSILALRSAPAAGMETLLPSAAAESAERLPGWYARATRLASYAASIFLLAPLAIAPVFLYAWVGEMGYVTRWTFTALAVGCAAGLVAVPAGTLVQALDRPGIQARAAIVSIALNIPLSLALVRLWGVEGAAAGTALAMTVSSLLLVRDAHRAAGLGLALTCRELVRGQWPLWLTCGGFALVTQSLFGRWFLATDVAVRYALPLRLWALALAALLYLGCVASMVASKVLLAGMDEDERTHVTRWRDAFRGWWGLPETAQEG